MRRTLGRLKATYLIPPAVALVLVGAWNAVQLKSISSLEKDAVVMRGKIATALASGQFPADAPTANRSLKSPSAAGKGAVDWREMSALMSENVDNGVANMRTILDFQQRLKEMSKEEMIASLDEIAGLGLSPEDRQTLEGLIIDPLIKEDPEYALKRFADRIEADPNGIGWQLSSAMRDWAKKDLAGATAWFDRQIAEGTFESKSLDGKSEMRVKFESALMETLLSSDLNAASQRLAAIPEDERREVLQQIAFEELAPADQKAYAELVRQLVPADERAGSFAHIASQLVNDSGYDKVSSFLDSVNATPEERAASAVQTAESRLESLGINGNVTRAEIDSLRAWLARQAPGQVDSITGKALAEAAQDRGKFQFPEASQLVLQYQKSSGSDDVLVSFLQSYSARSNLEEAQHLAEMISDEKRRAQILRQLK